MTVNYTIGDSNILLKEIPDGSIDLVVADPNYGVGKYEGDHLELSWLTEIYRALKKTGSFYVFGSVWYMPFIEVEAIRLGFILRNELVWYYENAMARQTDNFQMQYDPIAYFTKSQEFTFNLDDIREPYKSTDRVKYPVKKGNYVWTPNPLGRKRGNVLDIPALCGANYAEERTSHPTQKPEKVIEVLVRASSNPNDLVLDPFLGSGTTLIVCRKLGRNAIGYEINPNYEAIIKSRLEKPYQAEVCGHEEKVKDICAECEALGGTELSEKGRKRLEKVKGTLEERIARVDAFVRRPETPEEIQEMQRRARESRRDIDEKLYGEEKVKEVK